MYSSSPTSKRLVLVPILVVVVLIRSVLSINMTNAYLQHKCFVNQGKYKLGSEYEKDLTSIIHSISRTSDFSSGYEMMTYGGGPNYVSVVLQCRGDSYGPKCRSCYATALSGLRSKCPRYKGGIIWYDQCLLEFSGIDKVWQIDYDNNFCMTNAKSVSGNEVKFNLEWIALVDNLTVIATKKDYNNPTTLYAAGERRLGAKTLYGMVQCTRDIGKKGCLDCMAYYVTHFYRCFNGRTGARVLGRSCNFRFEFYPFVNTKSELET